MNTALVIMAAGIGSRFGGGIKQLEPVGPAGEIIMDYSIHDAIEAGFSKIVFVIRHDIEEDFKEVIGERIEKICARCGVEVCYAFQELDGLPEGFEVPEGRTKPWGTGQAIIAAKPFIKEPFVVINADDYYGKEAFRSLRGFLGSNSEPNAYCMAGFILKNTLSDNGGVTRGICEVDGDGYLVDVLETRGIVKDTENGMVKAKVGEREIDIESLVSMNMWGLTPGFFDIVEGGFIEFLNLDVQANTMKAEYLLPNIIAKYLAQGDITVKLLQTHDKWFGVTYKEDKPTVVESFKKLISEGVYSERLFDNLP